MELSRHPVDFVKPTARYESLFSSLLAQKTSFHVCCCCHIASGRFVIENRDALTFVWPWVPLTDCPIPLHTASCKTVLSTSIVSVFAHETCLAEAFGNLRLVLEVGPYAVDSEVCLYRITPWFDKIASCRSCWSWHLVDVLFYALCKRNR